MRALTIRVDLKPELNQLLKLSQRVERVKKKLRNHLHTDYLEMRLPRIFSLGDAITIQT
jgi:hypothetical protein